MRSSPVLSGLCVFALVGGFLVADVAAAPEASACSSGLRYYPTWGTFNRQELSNYTNPNRLYFYQDRKVGRTGAVAGKSTTGGRGYAYCGTDFFYSVDKNL